MKHLSDTTAKFSDLLRKIVVFAATAALVLLVLMFSAVLFAIIIVVATIAWAYLWWKTRHLRTQMQDFSLSGVVRDDEVVEGEVIECEVIRVQAPLDRS